MTAVSPADIERAAERIKDRVRTTPVVSVEVSGRPVLLKLECLQHTGSFKPRGAFNRALAAWPLPPAGVITASGGNHGSAVAYVASRLGVPAEVFIPEAAGEVKRRRIAGYGARVVVTGAFYADAVGAAEQRAAETGALMIHAYDHPDTVAGQGTVGRELETQNPELDTVLVAVGGGGLIGGIAAWFERRVEVVGVEPETAPTLERALAAGYPVDVEVGGVAADSLGARRVGAIAFEIARRAVTKVVLVSDQAILAARGWLWEELRIVAEPGGAAALAAMLSGAYQPEPEDRVGVLVCGANTDPVNL